MLARGDSHGVGLFSWSGPEKGLLREVWKIVARGNGLEITQQELLSQPTKVAFVKGVRVVWTADEGGSQGAD